MAEAAAAAVAWLTEGEVILTAFEAFAAAAVVELAAATAYNNYAKRRAADKMKEARNASLRDRYVMTRNAIAARRIVLGRQRVSGSVSFIKSYGANKEKLVVVLPVSAEQIDGYEEIYFDDELVKLDGSGNVLGVNRREDFTLTGTGATFTLQGRAQAGTVSAVVKYGSTAVTLGVSLSGADVTVSGGTAGQTGTVTIKYLPDPSPFVRTEWKSGHATITLNGSGTGSVTLPQTPSVGPQWSGIQAVNVVYGAGDGDVSGINLFSYVSVSGATVTVTAAPYPGATVDVAYTYQDLQPNRAKITTYTGAPGQVADPDIIAALPGVWTSAHVGNGIAYIKAEMDFDPDAFPSSVPNISALVRGSRLYDPRTGQTVFSENPALMVRHIAYHPLFGRLKAGRVPDESIIVAANVCDTTANYVVAGKTYTRPRYTAGLVAIAGTRADDIIQDLCEAMGGERAFVDGGLRVKAGAWVTPLQTLEESWLIRERGAIQVQRRRPKPEVSNIITGVFADEQNDYQVRDFPTIRSQTYIDEDREELPDDIEFNAITFSGQAQQVAAQRMRRRRFGRRITVGCNYRAFAVEWGDVLYVNLPSRFGYQLLPCEVLDVQFGIENGILLTMEEITPAIWDIGSSFAEVPLRPNTFLPSPSTLPDVIGLAVDSTASVQVRNPDGTVTPRMRVSWDAFSDQRVLGSGGGVEIKYGLPGWAESQWISVRAEAPARSVDIVGMQQGQLYIVKARTYSKLTNGYWTPHYLVLVGERGVLINDFPTPVTVASKNITGTSGTSSTYTSIFWTLVGTITFTARITTDALVSVTGIAKFSGSPSTYTDKIGCLCRIKIDWDNDGNEEAGDEFFESFSYIPTTGAADGSAPIETTRRRPVVAGVTYTWPVYAQKFEGTLVLEAVELRVRSSRAS